MRRILSVLVAVLALAALVSPAPAQSVFGPGGMIYLTTASVSVSNTTAATSLFSYTVPAGLAQGNFAPLHLKLMGVLTTQSTGPVGAMNLSCNYGGSTASVAMVNGITFAQGLSRAPLTIDVYVHGYPGVTVGQQTAITGAMIGRTTVNTAAGTGASYGAQVDSTTPSNVSQTLACNMQWGSASTTNTLIITQGSLFVDN